MDEAEILIYSEIGPAMFGMVDDVMVIDALNKMQDSKKISVRLNSPGGDAFMGISIKNAFKRHPAKITVHVDALAASAAAIVAMGGDQLVMHEGSMLMIHNAWTISVGNSAAMAKAAETLEKVDQDQIDIYHRKSGLDKGKIKQMLDAETWLRATEARDLGLADSADTTPTGAKACLPHGWYSRAPEQIGRYAMNDKTRIAAMTGLTISEKSKSANPDDAARKALWESRKKQLLVK